MHIPNTSVTVLFLLYLAPLSFSEPSSVDQSSSSSSLSSHILSRFLAPRVPPPSVTQSHPQQGQGTSEENNEQSSRTSLKQKAKKLKDVLCGKDDKDCEGEDNTKETDDGKSTKETVENTNPETKKKKKVDPDNSNNQSTSSTLVKRAAATALPNTQQPNSLRSLEVRLFIPGAAIDSAAQAGARQSTEESSLLADGDKESEAGESDHSKGGDDSDDSDSDDGNGPNSSTAAAVTSTTMVTAPSATAAAVTSGSMIAPATGGAEIVAAGKGVAVGGSLLVGALVFCSL